MRNRASMNCARASRVDNRYNVDASAHACFCDNAEGFARMCLIGFVILKLMHSSLIKTITISDAHLLCLINPRRMRERGLQ